MAEIFQSNFVLGLQGNLYQDFVNQVARPIIQDIVGTDDYKIIDFDKHLSSLDFNQSKRKDSIFPEFYLNFLGDIVKDDDSVSFKKKVCITLDERLCTDICQNTGRKITAIKLAGVELAYFIYFDVKEFFYFVYHGSIKKFETKQESLENNNVKNANQREWIESIKDTDKLIEVDSSENLGKLFELNILDNISNEQGKNFSNIIKVGYIRNHTNKYTYIRTSLNRGDIFSIKHTSFPNIKDLPIGATIKAECLINDLGKIVKVESYSPVSVSELNFHLNKFEGKLKRKSGEDSTFMDSQNTVIYVPPRCAKHFKENKIYNVQCLAAQFLDKNNNLNWEALEVIEIS